MGSRFLFIVALASPAFCQTKDIRLPGTDSNSPDTKVKNYCHHICVIPSPHKMTPQIFSTGNSAIDGGIIGLGLGALGAAVLGPTLNQVGSGIDLQKYILSTVSTGIYIRQCLHPRHQGVGGGRDRQMGRRGHFLTLLAQFLVVKITCELCLYEELCKSISFYFVRKLCQFPGSSFPVEVRAHVVVRKGRLLGMEASNPIQSKGR